METNFKATDRYGNEVEFELCSPDNKAEIDAEFQYRIGYSIALKAGILPREGMREIMKKTETWTDENEKEYKDLIKDIAVAENKLDEYVKKSNFKSGGKLAKDLAKLRTRLWEIFAIQNSAFVQSCEGYAETIRREALYAACVKVKATNQRYWPTYKDYVIERDENDKATVVLKFQEIMINQIETLHKQYISSLPEQEFLMKAKA